MSPEALEFALNPENLKNVMHAYEVKHKRKFDVPLDVIAAVLDIIKKTPIETTQSGLKKNPKAAPSKVTRSEPTFVFCGDMSFDVKVPADTAANEGAVAEVAEDEVANEVAAAEAAEDKVPADTAANEGAAAEVAAAEATEDQVAEDEVANEVAAAEDEVANKVAAAEATEDEVESKVAAAVAAEDQVDDAEVPVEATAEAANIVAGVKVPAKKPAKYCWADSDSDSEDEAEGKWKFIVRKDKIKNKKTESIKAYCKCGKEKFPGHEMCRKCHKNQFVMCSKCNNKVPKWVIPVGKDGNQLKPMCRDCLYG